jgi:hypothetical protein
VSVWPLFSPVKSYRSLVQLFSLSAWRDMMLCNDLAGTTLPGMIL